MTETGGFLLLRLVSRLETVQTKVVFQENG